MLTLLLYFIWFVTTKKRQRENTTPPHKTDTNFISIFSIWEILISWDLYCWVGIFRVRPLGPLFMQAPWARDCFVPVKQKFLDEQRYFQNAEQLVPFWWVVDLTWANVRHVTALVACWWQSDKKNLSRCWQCYLLLTCMFLCDNWLSVHVVSY